MAIDRGFKYFAKVPWKKGNFIANTGRKSTNIEDVMIFSKGSPRKLKFNAKENLKEAKKHHLDINGLTTKEVKAVLEQKNLPIHYMSGTNGMLPTEFYYQPKSKKDKVMEAEKPIELIEEIIDYISIPYEILLDQFGGSDNFAVACINKNRNAIVIEKDEEIFTKMKRTIEQNLEIVFEEIEQMNELTL